MPYYNIQPNIYLDYSNMIDLGMLQSTSAPPPIRDVAGGDATRRPNGVHGVGRAGLDCGIVSAIRVGGGKLGLLIPSSIGILRCEPLAVCWLLATNAS